MLYSRLLSLLLMTATIGCGSSSAYRTWRDYRPEAKLDLVSDQEGPAVDALVDAFYGANAPFESRCFSVRDEVKPSAPASRASRTTSPIASISWAVATSRVGPRSPITKARTAPWGTWEPTSMASCV